jgi:serine/threonine protein phosphatase PrpC
MNAPLRWTSVALSHVGRVRHLNEDAVCNRPDAGLWAIADGMGGHAAGDVASQLIVNALERLKPHADLGLMVDFVEHSLLEVNNRLLELAAAAAQTIGSTVVALVAVGHHAAYLWAGDSRLYRLRAGRLRQLTTDHSQVERMIEQGLLARAEAAHHPLSHLLTRAVGAQPGLCIELDICPLQAGDRFLLCSDGLDKHVADDELARYLTLPEADICANKLLELTLARGATDNVSLCIVDIA